MDPSNKSCCVTSAASAALWRLVAAHGGAPGLLRYHKETQLWCLHMTYYDCTCMT